jgi:hypothetical protein
MLKRVRSAPADVYSQDNGGYLSQTSASIPPDLMQPGVDPERIGVDGGFFDQLSDGKRQRGPLAARPQML